MADIEPSVGFHLDILRNRAKVCFMDHCFWSENLLTPFPAAASLPPEAGNKMSYERLPSNRVLTTTEDFVVEPRFVFANEV